MKPSVKLTATLIACCMVIMAVAQTSMDYSFMVEDIEFQPGVTIDINVNVYVNENATVWADHGKIIAVEGMAHTANCWKPFAEELFLNGPQGAHLNEFYAIDMPGRGGSGLPEYSDPDQPFLLDQMYIEDYLVVIDNVIKYINEVRNVNPKTLMGHSLGGLEVILLQDTLLKQGSNLRTEYGIKNAITLAPGIPAPLDWAFVQGGGGSALLGFVSYIPGVGTMLDIPYYVWPFIFFTNNCGIEIPNMVPGAPIPAVVAANGYNSIEPGPLCLQIAGMPIPPGMPYPYMPRKPVVQDIFRPDHGVQLTLFADECDKMMLPSEEMALYLYLTGDDYYRNYLFVEGEETCHDTHISDPAALVALLDNPNFFKSSAVDEPLQDQSDIKVYPNPSTGSTFISFYLPCESDVELKVFNVVGQEVTVLVNESMPAGLNRENFDLGALPDGVYLLKLDAGTIHTSTSLIKKK